MSWPPPLDPLIHGRARPATPPSTGPTDPAAPPAARAGARRKPVAVAGRVTSVALSIAATGGLTWSFAHADASGGPAPRAALPPPPRRATTTTTTTTAPVTTEPAAPDVVDSGTTPDVAATEPSSSTVAATQAPPALTGTFTGDPVQTRYGPVQVQVTYANGTITKASAVVYPTRSRRDLAINRRAIPILQAETLTAQSAQIDTVSGATYTTYGYIDSLQSAIDAAHAH